MKPPARSAHPPQKRNPNPGSHPAQGRQQVISVERQSGPLPDPQSFAQYDIIVPGAAERILVMAEQESEHLRTLQNRTLDAQILNYRDTNERAKDAHRLSSRGQLFGLLSVMLSFSVAAYALFLGDPGVAGTICSATVVGLVTVFVTGRRKESITNQKRDKVSNG